VDVLEGMCTQTHAVLFKALKDRMRPCLILNKIDRLALEMKLTPTEAFHHLRRIVENVNALAFTLLNSELRSRIERDSDSPSADVAAASASDPHTGESLFTV
jgi:ribosome assembly protein 1